MPMPRDSHFGPWSEGADTRTMGGMTGRAGHPGRQGVAAAATFAALSLLAAVGLSACGTDVANADTVLQDPRAATVRLDDGTTRSASAGMKVPHGATVTTAAGGSAALVTAGRVVLLGSDTVVAVVDGRREQLRKGLVMIDARRAGDLALDAGAATVNADRGALTRVERDVLLRVATFRKGVSVRAASRRATVDVPALHQVQVPYGGLPGRVTALGLTRDAWERRYALDLVTSDVDLSNLAAGLDADPESGSAVARAVPASYVSSAPLAAGEPRSEGALGFLVARAAGGSDGEQFATVRRLRAEGGSWGVVAAIVGAKVGAVSAALDALLAPDEEVLVAAPGQGTIDVGGLLGGSSGTGSGSADPGTASPRPTRGPSASPKPSPGPSSSPDPVDEVVKTVTSLLPTPPPSTAPAPSSSPLIQVEVGGVTVGIG